MINTAVAEESLNIHFQNKDLLCEALTHRSFLNENRLWPYSHNERLEFLGDAVLELVVTEYLYLNFPKRREGEMTTLRTALVNGEMLGKVGVELGIEGFLLMSRGETRNQGRARIFLIANVVEALIGALYLDQGLEKAKEFITRIVLSRIDEVVQNGVRDTKSLLQEKAQALFGITPTYKVLDETGKDHEKHFVVGAYLRSELIATGNGSSKREAENRAAGEALTTRNWNTV